MQYYVGDLKETNERRKPEYKMEYVTFGREILVPLRGEKVYRPYWMEDLTIKSWYSIGKRIGSEREIRKRFKDMMYFTVGY
jgi:endopolyphosphatase